MKKIILLLSAGLLILACSFSQASTPVIQNPGTIVAETFQAMTDAAPPPATLPPTEPPAPLQPTGNQISFSNVSFTLSGDVAANALAGTIPAVTGGDPGWGVAPEHIKFELDGYPLSNTFHDPQILVYPANEYAAMHQGAATSMAHLRVILEGNGTPPAESLPTIPDFNAAQLFAAQIKVIQFKSGSGVRFLAEYGQYSATANNIDLFYEFQGLTSDGKYYIIAILPISQPLLANDEKPETNPPAGGIPFPGYDDPNAITAYYISVVDLLNNATPESFLPGLASLDALIQSIEVH
jgi:hypothetical protein